MTPKKNIYLYGAGGHSNVIREILEESGHAIKGVFDDNPVEAKLQGIKVEDGVRALGKGFPKLDAPLVISVGSNSRRSEIAALLDVEYGVAIHPTAIISPSATVGPGSVILHGAIVQAGTKIGAHVLINTAANIDHDNVIDDYAHVSPHATLCGHVHVGEGTHIGAAAVVIQCVNIGKWCTVGAGSVVLRDVPDYATVVGNPARVIRVGEPPTGTDSKRENV